MQITLRPAVTEDFDYCKRLYFTGRKTIIEAVSFEQQWELTQVRIILLETPPSDPASARDLLIQEKPLVSSRD